MWQKGKFRFIFCFNEFGCYVKVVIYRDIFKLFKYRYFALNNVINVVHLVIERFVVWDSVDEVLLTTNKCLLIRTWTN